MSEPTPTGAFTLVECINPECANYGVDQWGVQSHWGANDWRCPECLELAEEAGDGDE